MASIFLRDVQTEHPYLISRWLMREAVGSQYVYDDTSGITLPITGAPVLGQPSLARKETLTSARGGSVGSTPAGFSASVASFALTSGVSVEGIVCMGPAMGTFNLFSAPGQTSLVVAGTSVQFSVWTGAQHTLTASGVLTGVPQHVIGTYDPVAQFQTIYVDGAQVAQQTLSGAVAASTTANTVLLTSAGTNVVALGQDIAVYNGALPQSRVTEHFQAFAQVWTDPTRVHAYGALTVGT